MNKFFCCCIIINRIIIYNFRTLLCLTCLLFAYFSYTKLTYVRFLMCFCKTQKLLPFGMCSRRRRVYVMYVTHVRLYVVLCTTKDTENYYCCYFIFYFINNCRRSLSCAVLWMDSQMYEWIVICVCLVYVCMWAT